MFWVSAFKGYSAFSIQNHCTTGIQDWNHVSSQFWIRQAVDIVLGSIVKEPLLAHSASGVRIPGFEPLSDHVGDDVAMQIDSEDMSELDPEQQSLRNLHVSLIDMMNQLKVRDIVDPLSYFAAQDTKLAYDIWASIFPLVWNVLNGRERHDAIKCLISLLAKDYHSIQVDARPNVIQCLLEGISRCTPPIQLPPQLLKYLAKTFNSWHIVLEMLQKSSLPAQRKKKGSETMCWMHWQTFTLSYLSVITLLVCGEDGVFLQRQMLLYLTNSMACGRQPRASTSLHNPKQEQVSCHFQNQSIDCGKRDGCSAPFACSNGTC
jgi:hypothetical protein